MLRRVAVFAGRDDVVAPEELTSAHRIGTLLCENAVTVLFGGPPTGPLAALVETVTKAGGRPEAIDTALGGWRTELSARADGFVGLPGGFAALESAFDVWAWDPSRLDQPLGLLDEGDYFSKLLRFATDAAVDRFVQESQRGRLIVTKDASELLRRMKSYRPPETRRDLPALDDD
jgi:predicted Rossmann-fold nucleotide-binding protein